ncbi:hypothetical protein Tco_0702573 [Tanacetum coccineum]|uniref:RTR1-type domain-containing protein n=1 Tax=Tanacetum coccineum TaxID=301880 RepID=A0ABQ4XY54_9ASTR
MLRLRESMDLDLEARLMEETLILNRSFDPLYGDYIKLNDLNEPLDLRRNRNDDLEPTIEEGEVVNEPMMDLVKTRCDFIDGLNDYPSCCDYDRKIHVNCTYNLKNLSFLENMDIYHDKDMGDVIIGEPFCKVSCVEAKRRITPLFQTMMVQAPEDMGEDSAPPTNSHSTPIITQPSSSKPQKKKSRRKRRKDIGPTEPILDKATNEEHVSTPSYDPPQSGEDRLQLTELMSLCTNLQEKVLDLEEAKTA